MNTVTPQGTPFPSQGNSPRIQGASTRCPLGMATVACKSRCQHTSRPDLPSGLNPTLCPFSLGAQEADPPSPTDPATPQCPQ